METNDPTNVILQRIISLSQRELQSFQNSVDEATKTSQTYLILSTFIFTVIMGLFGTNNDNKYISVVLVGLFLLTGYSACLLIKNLYHKKTLSILDRNTLEKLRSFNEVETLEFELNLTIDKSESLADILKKKYERLFQVAIHLAISLGVSIGIVIWALILEGKL
ncbi:hypothetical protein [Algoriphagus sp. NG3]|uniref:hypothetical protein n=1 Tax=Algoriphagus sp. NG3 TaxID=3097546 RepID=UPI002A7F6D30|nr:hypothetical protein [Algoriphagus sp. NG3]WPR77713.1 hypothetical protein SLW71_10195 [Algoriphagus sp. NG3]